MNPRASHLNNMLIACVNVLKDFNNIVCYNDGVLHIFGIFIPTYLPRMVYNQYLLGTMM
jgi:hypothetical protein